MKTGILGGTFNPIHNAHLSLGKAAKLQFNLDKMIFMPSNQPAYKGNVEILPFEHRLNMVELGVDEILHGESEGFFVSDFESKREGNTYTYETLSLLKDTEPDTEFYFVIGADSLMAFDKWKHPELIAKATVLLVAERVGYSSFELQNKATELKDTFGADIRFIDYVENEISSTDIRKDIISGKLWETDLPFSVQKYIFDTDIYSIPKRIPTFSKSDINELTMKMCRLLSPQRFQHTLGVAYMSADLAAVYGIEADKATVAGLLHDCAKEIPKDEQEALCDRYGIELREVERRQKQLIHGRLGAYLAHTEYGIDDNEVLTAICNHTVGRPNMSLLEQIVFCADFLEPLRDFYSAPDLNYLRKLIFKDIDKVTYLIINISLTYLADKDQEIDPATAETGAYYKKLIDEREDK